MVDECRLGPIVRSLGSYFTPSWRTFLVGTHTKPGWVCPLDLGAKTGVDHGCDFFGAAPPKEPVITLCEVTLCSHYLAYEDLQF